MVVLKFGGSSVGQPERFGNALAIVQQYREKGIRPVVIASALSRVTDRLVEAGEGCCTDEFDTGLFLQWMHERHTKHASSVLPSVVRSRFNQSLSVFLYRTHNTMEGLKQETDPASILAAKDEILAVGERLSVHLFANALIGNGLKAVPVDAAALIQTDNTFGAGSVYPEATNLKIQKWFSSLPDDVIPVVTGFIGSAPDGRTTTLGRGGSDYSASILAAGIGASKLERWTDVDGVYTSDPNVDPKAKRLDYIVMEDVLSWNKAGKMGLHRKALDPLIGARIPLFVRSIDSPDKPGTEVQPRTYQQAIAC